MAPADQPVAGDATGGWDAFYRQIIDAAGMGILVSRHGQVIYANQWLCEITGYTLQEITGQSFFDLVHSEDRERVTGLYLAKINGKPVPPGDRFRVISRQGRSVWLQSDAVLANLEGKPLLISYLSGCEDQKQLEQALQQSEKQYRTLFENLSLPAFFHDADGTPVDVNAAALRILGITRKQFFDPKRRSHIDEWLGKNRLPFSAEEHPIRRALKSATAVHNELAGVYNQNEKRYVWFNVHAIPIGRKGETSADRVFVTLHDLTDLNRSQKALRESERRFKAAAKSARDLIYEWDIGKKSLEWYGDIDGALGFEANELPRTLAGWLERIHPSDRQRLQREIDRCWNGRRSLRTKYRVQQKDGAWLYWEERLRINYGPDDQPVKAIGVCSDVTERQRAEEALKESHERFFTVLNSIDATVSVIDLHTYEILFLNQHGIDTFGEDFTGQICHSTFRGESEPCPHCTNNWLLDDQGRSTGVCQWEGRNPVTGKWYMNYDRAIKWVDGRWVRLQVATDITRQKKLEKEQEAIKKQLRRTQRMEAIAILAGGIAHDFNNILTIIRGYTEIAQMAAEPGSRQHEQLAEALRAGDRAAALVQQVLTFSRQTEQPRQLLQLASLVKESTKFLRSSLPATIDVRQTIAEDLANVTGDPTRVLQVLMNLCTNAAHAMGEAGGVLSVGLKNVDLDAQAAAHFARLKPGRYVVLSVSDTGHGIAPETLPRIFEPHFTTKEDWQGSGLGLAIVQGIVREYQGEIKVDTLVGEGSTFSVFLPAAVPPATAGKAAPGAPPTGSGRILFVDDEPAIERLGQQMLKRLGYDVDSLTDPAQALDLFMGDPQRFDVVITDLTMPGIQGDRLAREIKRVRPGIPVILCTGNNDPISYSEERGSPFDQCLMKPISLNELAVAVKQALGRTGATGSTEADA